MKKNLSRILALLWPCFKLYHFESHLRISEKLAEVYVKEVARGLDHDVVVVTVSQTQDVRDDAVAGTGPREVVHGHLLLIRGRIVLGQPLAHRTNVKHALDSLAVSRLQHFSPRFSQKHKLVHGGPSKAPGSVNLQNNENKSALFNKTTIKECVSAAVFWVKLI